MDIIENDFPNLNQTNFRITSEPTSDYNCFAWAAGDINHWWEPDNFQFWPEETPIEFTIDSFIQAYATKGFTPCNSGEFEPGYEKIAIYVDKWGEPTHAARQLNSGKWNSKLGRGHDIEHELDGVSGSLYGSVAQFLKKSLA